MKILVFDDTQKHRDAAVALLKGHEVTVVGTYDEAQAALLPELDEPGRQVALDARVGVVPDHKSVSEEVWKEYWRQRYLVSGELEEQFTTRNSFDAVLTDLMVPASGQAQGKKGSPLVGQEMPLGSIIALFALAQGVKKVAVVTDMNHHHHPASAALDCFDRVGGSGDVRVFCTNHEMVRVDEQTMEVVDSDYLCSPEGQKKYPAPPDSLHDDPKGICWVKNWWSVLEHLCS